MPRNDGRLEPGQRLNGAISARAWNRMCDAADMVLGDSNGITAGTAFAADKPYSWVYCKPNFTVDRWGVVAITGVDITPTATESDTATRTFQDSPVVTGGAPSATTTAWGVAVEPIASGSIGRLAVGGVVQCKVEVTAAEDKFVACKASATELKTGSAGEGLVLWKQSGTGAGRWALVRLGGGSAVGVKRGTFEAPWSKGSTNTVTDAVASEITYANVRNYFASIPPSTPQNYGPRNCAIANVNNEWILIAAEC